MRFSSSPPLYRLELASSTVAFTLLRARRGKRLSLRVNEHAEVIVRIPWRVSVREAEAFVRTNEDWLIKRLHRAETNLTTRRPLVDGACLPLLDRRLCLRLHRAERGAVKLVCEELHVYSATHEREVLTQLLEVWYRRQAKIYMTERLAALGASTGLRAASLTIRGQRSCWGSCSARGAISINWRLMLAPSDIVDYVLAHELCHLCRMNHSVEFWDLVEKMLPDYQARRARLRALQPLLYL